MQWTCEPHSCPLVAYLMLCIQYNSPGFTPNIRQYRQLGLAAIELAQACVQHWRNKGKTQVLDSSSSNKMYWGSECTLPPPHPQTHPASHSGRSQ